MLCAYDEYSLRQAIRIEGSTLTDIVTTGAEEI